MLQDGYKEANKLRKMASEESKRRAEVEKEMLGTYEKVTLLMVSLSKNIEISNENYIVDSRIYFSKYKFQKKKKTYKQKLIDNCRRT